MQYFIFLLIAILAGAVLPVQATFNHKIGQTIGHPLWSALLSFIVGAVGLFAYMLATRVPLSLALNARNVSPYLWLGGLMGAFYVSSVIILVPRLGVALTFGLVVGGQMLIALLLDHFGLLGLPVKSINIYRALGALLIVAGVILIRKF